MGVMKPGLANRQALLYVHRKSITAFLSLSMFFYPRFHGFLFLLVVLSLGSPLGARAVSAACLSY